LFRVIRGFVNQLLFFSLFGFAPTGKKVLPIYINPFGGQCPVADSGLMGPVKLGTLTEESKN